MPYYHNNLPILCKIVTLIYLSFCQIFRKFGSFRTYFEQCLLGNRNLKRGYYHWFSGDFAHILTASGKTQDRLYSSAHEIYFKRVRSSGRSISWLIASSSVWTIKSSQLSFTSETWYSSASGRMVKTVSSVKAKPQIH